MSTLHYTSLLFFWTLAFVAPNAAAKELFEPFAVRVLENTSRFYASQQQFNLIANVETNARRDSDAQHAEAIVRLQIQRPNCVKYSVQREGVGTEETILACDGTLLYAFSPNEARQYSVLRAPTTCRQMLRHLPIRILMNSALPLSIVMASNDTNNIFDDIETISYQGKKVIDNCECHHIRAKCLSKEWNLFIDADDRRPLIRQCSSNNLHFYREHSTNPNARDNQPSIYNWTLATSSMKWQFADDAPKVSFITTVTETATKLDTLAAVVGLPESIEDAWLMTSGKAQEIVEAFDEYQFQLSNFQVNVSNLQTMGLANSLPENTVHIKVSRPSQLVIESKQQLGVVFNIFCDGEQTCIHNVRDRKYLISKAMRRWDQGIWEDVVPNSLSEDLAMRLLLSRDPIQELMQLGSLKMKYSGEATFYIYKCHEIEAKPSDGDGACWRLWIETGESPRLRGIARISKASTNTVSGILDQVRLDDWDVMPHFAAGDFSFNHREDAKAVRCYSELKTHRKHTLLNKEAPQLSVTLPDGTVKIIPISAQKHVTLLVFWHGTQDSAEWVLSCVSDVSRQYPNGEVLSVAVNLGEDSRAINRMNDRMKFYGVMSLDRDRLARNAYEAGLARPMIFVIGPDNQIREVIDGAPLDLNEQLKASINRTNRDS